MEGSIAAKFVNIILYRQVLAISLKSIGTIYSACMQQILACSTIFLTDDRPASYRVGNCRVRKLLSEPMTAKLDLYDQMVHNNASKDGSYFAQVPMREALEILCQQRRESEITLQATWKMLIVCSMIGLLLKSYPLIKHLQIRSTAIVVQIDGVTSFLYWLCY